MLFGVVGYGCAFFGYDAQLIPTHVAGVFVVYEFAVDEYGVWPVVGFEYWTGIFEYIEVTIIKGDGDGFVFDGAFVFNIFY